MAATMIFVILIFSSSVLLFNNIINIAKSNLEDTKTSFRVQQFKLIWGSLDHLHAQAEENSKLISSNIEYELKNLSESKIQKLREDMDKNSINEDLHKILNDNIKNVKFNGINNHRNGIVVMTSEGFIEDFNYRRASTSKEGALLRDWETGLETSYNKQLDKDAIDKLLNRSSGIIAMESYDLTKNSNHIKIKELTYETLLEVFCEEGIEGLRNYQIFVPSYITDTGDIFGTDDIVHGTKVENHKIIVVQEFNLYDQIMINDGGIFSDEEVDETDARYSDLFNMLYTFGLVLIAAVCALIFYFCDVYNRILELEEYECQQIINEENTQM
jgi:hypothetical protein